MVEVVIIIIRESVINRLISARINDFSLKGSRFFPLTSHNGVNAETDFGPDGLW